MSSSDRPAGYRGEMLPLIGFHRLPLVTTGFRGTRWLYGYIGYTVTSVTWVTSVTVRRPKAGAQSPTPEGERAKFQFVVKRREVKFGAIDCS